MGISRFLITASVVFAQLLTSLGAIDTTGASNDNNVTHKSQTLKSLRDLHSRRRHRRRSDDWYPSPSDDWHPSPSDDWRSSPSDDWYPSPSDDWRPSPSDDWRPSPSDDWRPSPSDDWYPGKGKGKHGRRRGKGKGKSHYRRRGKGKGGRPSRRRPSRSRPSGRHHSHPRCYYRSRRALSDGRFLKGKGRKGSSRSRSRSRNRSRCRRRRSGSDDWYPSRRSDDWYPSPSDDWRPSPSDDWRPSPSDDWRPSPSDDWRPSPSDDWRPSPSDDWRPSPSDDWQPSSPSDDWQPSSPSDDWYPSGSTDDNSPNGSGNGSGNGKNYDFNDDAWSGIEDGPCYPKPGELFITQIGEPLDSGNLEYVQLYFPTCKGRVVAGVTLYIIYEPLEVEDGEKHDSHRALQTRDSDSISIDGETDETGLVTNCSGGISQCDNVTGRSLSSSEWGRRFVEGTAQFSICVDSEVKATGTCEGGDTYGNVAVKERMLEQWSTSTDFTDGYVIRKRSSIPDEFKYEPIVDKHHRLLNDNDWGPKLPVFPAFDAGSFEVFPEENADNVDLSTWRDVEKKDNDWHDGRK